MTRSDLVVIGAGPAGMAAAAQAAELGLSVIVLDEQPRAGGQIYRDVDRVAPLRGDMLGADYTHGATLTAGLQHGAITHVNGAVVWAIEDQFRISYTVNGRGAQIDADRLLLATGALERPMPLPGWTLPGVMTAGAGQILLKQSGVLARNAVLVGSGPLLYLIAAQMVRAGTPPKAMIETQSRSDIAGTARHLGGALRGWRYLVKGLKMLASITRVGVPRHTGATDIAIEGTDKAQAVTFKRNGRSHRIACDTVFLHHGVVPNTQAARSLNIAHTWDAAQRCFIPQLDSWGQSDKSGVFIAGDGAGIGGARAAEFAGTIAALQIAFEAQRLTREDRDRRAAAPRAKLAHELAVRPFLDAAYPPYAQALLPHDATIICRCEEITAGDIRSYAGLGCIGPNQTKAFGRAGMGPCQGRYCGLGVTAILVDATGQTPDETGYYRIRPPLKPVTLGELAGMDISAPDAAE
ncbi:FAD/NAD(P)-dependent oxidoreductase [Yoonia sediminilitoris]|uniref:Thioredoxin reductase n=1 Tax=Yoonia sediminilitoris TaxID=1286148 RepID=A0A2T6KMC2_9RHOB|nr:NAD(P)/FAD-dependent oxidoreductase [Yoonia sediminilitoris]PUB17356.1 thioredoxin reductase [Yoonia sediminilitoris]RCW97651.1 thioredoxin reductase [Yoonia sediminilitoris]